MTKSGKKSKSGAEEPKFTRPDLERMGMFSEIGYLSTGPYTTNTGEFCPTRAKGKQVLVVPTKKGFDMKDFKRIFEKEAYTEAGKVGRAARLKSKEKNVSATPFRPPNVGPKPVGKGSPFGTIEQQFPIKDKLKEQGDAFYEKTVSAARAAEQKEQSKKTSKDEKRTIMKNFIVNTPKKGTGYGYVGVTIGKSYDYQPSPYDLKKMKEKEEREEAKKKLISAKAFIPADAKNNTFSPYIPLEPTDAKKDEPEKQTKEDDKKEKPVPFRPTSAIKPCINEFPSYEPPFPFDKATYNATERKEQLAKKEHKKFQPAGVSHTMPVASIIQANVPKAPPVFIRDKLTALRSF